MFITLTCYMWPAPPTIPASADRNASWKVVSITPDSSPGIIRHLPICIRMSIPVIKPTI